MTYWEYKTVELISTATVPITIGKLETILDDRGQGQWELVGIYDLIGFPESPFAVFKRPTKYYGEPCDPDALVS